MSVHFTINETSGTVTDTSTGLTWQREVPDTPMNWAQAKKYAVELDLDGGGWRLPTIDELLALTNRRRKDPAIDVVAFPHCPSEWFWSGTPWGESGSAWGVVFSDGYSDGSYAGNTYRVRCVRGPK